jgi:FkbM family methyltransferase
VKDEINYCRIFIELLLKTGNLELARELARSRVWPFHISQRGDQLWLEPLDLNLSVARQWPWLFDNIASAITLKTGANATFYERQGSLGFDLGDFKLLASTGEELFTATEVFVENVYRFFPPRPIVVIDIGMNVGYASIQFAAMQQVVMVYSFEPFAKTYEQALRNVALNPKYASKIKIENVGLAGKDRRMTVEYAANFKGSAGIYNQKAGPESVEVEIHLRNAVEVLGSIIKSNPGLPIAVKIDCEGAEYEILEAWRSEGSLAKLSLIMIEWHRFVDEHHPKKLCDWLAADGFSIFAHEPFSGKVGMLYACRNDSAVASVQQH